MKIQSCSRMATDREAWKRVVEQVKTHKVVAPRDEGEVQLQSLLTSAPEGG